MRLHIVLPLLSLAAMLPAQLGKPTGFTINAQTATGNNGILGAACDSAGNYWVSSRALNSAGAHKLYKFDPAGTLVATYDQPLTYGATVSAGITPWGMRDLTYDGRYIYGGAETISTGNRILAFDTTTNTFSTTAAWPMVGGPGVTRALAFDPNGNGGAGTMWVGDFGNSIVEYDRAGNILRTVSPTSILPANGTGGASWYGAAYDPDRRTVWWFGQGGSSRGATVGVVGCEMSTAGPLPLRTGLAFFGDLNVPPTPPNPNGGIAGGLDFYMKNGQPTLLCVTQALNDVVYELAGRFNFGQGCGGDIGYSFDTPYGGNSSWRVTLENSGIATGVGALFLSPNTLTLPAPTPLFGANCFIHADPTSMILLGTAPITSNSTFMPIPLPIGVTGDLTLQWAEVGAPSPILLSDGGRVHIKL